MKLTKAQRDLLSTMRDGVGIAYSQDGEVGWLTPDGPRLETFGISDAELQNLRDLRLIAVKPEADDEMARFSPPEHLTPAGRAALAGARHE